MQQLDLCLNSICQIEKAKFDILNIKLLLRYGIFLQRYSDISGTVTKASGDQIKKAANLIKRMDLKDFSVFQFTNPGKLLPLFLFTLAHMLS